MAEKPQIDSRDSLQHIHAAAPVAQAVMRFQGDTAAVIIDPQKIAVIRLKGHGHTEVADILLHKRPGPAVGLQIPGKGQNRIQMLPGQYLMCLRIDMLDIQHYQVGELHKPVKLFNKRLVVRFKGNTGGIDTSVYIFGLGVVNKSIRKSTCIRGSPPVTVIPPFL